MDISKFLNDEEKAKQFFKLSCAFAAGNITSSLLGAWSIRRSTNQLKRKFEARNDLVKKYREEIRRIQNDVTLSGSERERQIEDIIKFVEMVLDQDLT